MAGNELKPCPFCGHDDTKIKKEMKNFIFKDGTPMRGMWYEAECEYCGCHLGPAPSREMLVENWNSRAEPEVKTQYIAVELDGLKSKTVG